MFVYTIMLCILMGVIAFCNSQIKHLVCSVQLFIFDALNYFLKSPPVKYFTDRSEAVLLLVMCLVFVMLSRLFIAALLSSAGKGLTCDVLLCFCHFPL